MSTFKIIKKGAGNFWHVYSNGAKEVNLSDFQVVLDLIAQTFNIQCLNGANIPNQSVQIANIRVIDETDGAVEETFVSVIALKNRLTTLGYTPYKSSTGIEEAPVDGNTYGRKDEGWVLVSGISGDYLKLDGTSTMDANAPIVFNNGSKLKEGTIDGALGGNKGIAQICAVGYELKWEAGRLYVMNDGGTTIREVSHTFTYTPSVSDDTTKGFIVGSRWILDNGDVYVCTDATTGDAVWVLLSTEMPTLQSVTNNGYITNNEVQSTYQISAQTSPDSGVGTALTPNGLEMNTNPLSSLVGRIKSDLLTNTEEYQLPPNGGDGGTLALRSDIGDKLNTDGSNANSNIDIGGYNFTSNQINANFGLYSFGDLITLLRSSYLTSTSGGVYCLNADQIIADIELNGGGVGDILYRYGNGNLQYNQTTGLWTWDGDTLATLADITAGVVDSVNGQTGVVVLDADDIADGTTNKAYTATEQTKLAGIASGAEVNVNADWNATSGDAQILNKPTIGVGDMLKSTYDTDNTGVVDNAEAIKIIGRNSTGSTLYKGTIVYISGSTGNRPNFVKAKADAESTSAGTFGVIASDLANNTDGYVLCLGYLDTLDTRSTATNPFTSDTLADGDTIYLSPTTAGYVTNVKPSAPNHLVYLGKVTRTSPTLGTIVYRVQNGYELDEIHDVAIASKTNNDVLQYDSASSLWKNKALTTASVSASTDKNYVTDAQATVIGNTSGTNSGDNATNSQYSGLASSKEDTANKSTSTSDSASTTKFPVWSAILSYFDASRIRTLLGITTLSGSNTGDQDLSSYAPKASPALTGSPTAPTQSQSDNSTKIATTAYVDTGLATKAIKTDLMILSSAYVLSNSTSLQKMFNVGSGSGGAFNATANKTYRFRIEFDMTGMSTSSGALSFGFLGTATISSISYKANALKNALATITAANLQSIQVSTITTITTATGNATAKGVITGIIRVSGAGTIIPAIATGIGNSTSQVEANSFFEIAELGSDTVTATSNIS